MNTKVYLAKHVLASGLDVDYVKSSLNRIEGIHIVENGMGFAPSECRAFVIVPEADFDISSTDIACLSKNVAKDLKDFLKNNDEGDSASDYVYVYSGKQKSDYQGDVESTTPFAALLCDSEAFGVVDKDDYNHYAEIETGEEDETSSLLGLIASDIHVYNNDWLQRPLRHQPAPEFALPAPPTLEERRLRVQNTSIYDEVGQYPLKAYQCYSPNRRLLLRRRK